MKRRRFHHLSLGASLGLGLPYMSCASQDKEEIQLTTEFEALTYSLLKEWCDGMIKVQIDKPEDATVHGALLCPACQKIHGRCMDAVYPFLYLANHTGEKKYLDAAINVMQWSENVSKKDGSWTVMPNPKSWNGITVFGAIALGEALHHHGHILPLDIQKKWKLRLAKAAEFIHENFTIELSHINYPFTAVYALNLLGRMFDNEEYLAHSRELASEVPNWLTDPNKLIFGENQPHDVHSDKGLPSVDLGYNVEETLNGLVVYAFLERDEELLTLLTESMEGHLEFMLPDGAWDNSWGTRQNKWSYWGSRTADGCQPAFGMMATRNAAFGTAAYLSTELLKACTVDGLIAGGIHYESHGLQPCIHHTFCHTKSLAFVLDNAAQFKQVSKQKPIPRAIANGVQHFPEIDVWLAARGPWRATVSSYDAVFKKKYSQAATGGSLAVLWHDKVGPIFTASMVEYLLVEPANQQPQPDGEDIPLTPRIECTKDGKWFSNLYDLKAKVNYNDDGELIQFDVATRLTDRERNTSSEVWYKLQYTFQKNITTLRATKEAKADKHEEAKLVLPIISPAADNVIFVTDDHVEIEKDSGKLILRSNVPLSKLPTKKERIFNMVPGMEAIPLVAFFSDEVNEIVCTIEIE